MGSVSSTTVMIIEPILASSGLSGELSVYQASLYNKNNNIIIMMMELCLCTAGEIAAVIVGVVCSLAGVCIICLFILLKMYPKLNRHSSINTLYPIHIQVIDSYTLLRDYRGRNRNETK